MKKFTAITVLLLILSFSLSAFLVACIHAELASGWSQTYGGTEDDYAVSLVQTSDGGYALAGYTYSFGVGNGDFWLVKTDEAGNMQWSQTYGGTEWDIGNSLVQTLDGGYALAGYTYSFGVGNNDFWLVKTDEQGVIPEFPDTTPRTSEPFPIKWVVAAIVITAIGGVALLVYLAKVKKTTEKAE